MSLARSGKPAMRSDCDIDVIAALHHVVFPEAMPPIDHVAAVLQMEFPAVPWTDDVHVVLVERLSEVNAVVADLLDHLRHLQPFTGRPALMRAQIAVGVVGALVKDHADLDRARLDETCSAVGDLAFPAHANFRHEGSD